MSNRKFTYLLGIVFIVQFTYPLFIQPIVGLRLYLLPPWDYFNYPEKKRIIKDVEVTNADHSVLLRPNLNYFDVYFFDHIVSHSSKETLLENLKKEYFYISEFKGPFKLVSYQCDPIEYFYFRYKGCSLEKEEALE